MINKKTLTIVLIPILIISMGVYGNRLFLDKTKGKVSTRISFNFEGVDEGLNPHGGVFDAQKIKSIEVVQDALDKLDGNIAQMDAKELSRNIMVRGIVPKDAMERIMPKVSANNNIQLEGIVGATYNPTQYEVALIMDRDIKLNKQEAKLVVDALIESYQEYFVQRYKDTQAIEAAITPIDPERYDYSEYITLTEGQLTIIKNYLTSKEQAAKDFRSSSTYLSFGDLIAQVELIQNVEVGNVKALVDSFMITRDLNKLSIVSESMIHKMKLEKEKYTKQANDLKNAANSYQKDKTILMGNGYLARADEDEEEETLYDQLVKQSIEAQSRADRMSGRQEYYEGLLINLQDQKQNGGNANTAHYVGEVEKSITYIAEQMNITMENIKETVDDYYAQEVFEGSITPVMSTRYQSSLRSNFIKDTFVVGVLVGLMAMVGAVYLLARPSKKKVNEDKVA